MRIIPDVSTYLIWYLIWFILWYVMDKKRKKEDDDNDGYETTNRMYVIK